MFLSFFFNDTATTEIYTLSLHDALPISRDLAPVEDDERRDLLLLPEAGLGWHAAREELLDARDRKSTRLNSRHAHISYAVFCLKKKNPTPSPPPPPPTSPPSNISADPFP